MGTFTHYYTIASYSIMIMTRQKDECMTGFIPFCYRKVFMLFFLLIPSFCAAADFNMWVGETGQYEMSGTGYYNFRLKRVSCTNPSVVCNTVGWVAKWEIKQYFPGTATIIIEYAYQVLRGQSYKDDRKTLTVSCRDNQVTVEPSNLTLKSGERYDLSYKFDSRQHVSHPSIQWSTDDWSGKVITVNSSGRVTAKGPGTATVYLDHNQGSNRGTCVVTVSPNEPERVSLDNSLSLTVNETKTLYPSLFPDGTSTIFSWDSDNHYVATVDQSGNVTGWNEGTAKISVRTANNLTASCEVIVSKPVSKKTLQLSVSPSGGEVAKGAKLMLTANSNGTSLYDADIYYTLDGTIPSRSSSKYTSSGIIINESCVLQAIAYKHGYETSGLLIAHYTVDKPITGLELSASPFGGTIDKGTKVTLDAKEGGSSINNVDIYYTLDGTTPTSRSIKYTSSGIIINESCTLQAIAYKEEYKASDVLTTTYIIKNTEVENEQQNDAVVQVEAGTGFSFFLMKDGTLWACGTNYYGELGDNTDVDRFSPVKIMNDVAYVSAGDTHTMIVKKDGTLWACGNNREGQLGIVTGIAPKNPLPLKVMSNVESVAAGYEHSMIIKKDGTLWACGSNYYGQLGQGVNIREGSTPISIMSDVKSAATGGKFSLILKNDGTVWGCGSNSYGQLGDGTTSNRFTPVIISSDIISVSTGFNHSLILQKDGSLWVFGRNDNGQLGDGSKIDRTSPVKIMSDVSYVSAGAYHSLIVKKDGTLWSWGYNHNGRLGDGTTIDRIAPVKVMTDVVSVSAGSWHSIIIKKDGTIWTCGYNTYGCLGDGTTTDRHTPVMIFNGKSWVGATAINDLTVKPNIVNHYRAVFSLSGQRLSKPRKGLNIINGRKVYVK